MITGIDHIVLICPALQTGIDTLATLLGRAEDWRSQADDGSASALFQCEHMALEVLAPQGSGPLADRLTERLAEDGPGLQSVVFASNDIESDRQRGLACGLEPSAITAGRSEDLATGRVRHWRRFRLADAHTGGLRTFILQRETDDPLRSGEMADDALIDLDHLVITSANATRAREFFGKHLQLPLLLDRENRDNRSRLLVFGAGESGIEVACRDGAEDEAAPDRPWGMTWKTRDIDAAHRRLADAGLNVSSVRDGLRRGTRVFSIRDGTLGVPTLVVAGDNRPR